MDEQRIYASFDAEGVYIYQAFCPKIADTALERGTFGVGFSLERMTWIKPSLGWMMYRSGYASKVNQERVLRIKIATAGFEELLMGATLATFHPAIYGSRAAWEQELKNTAVRVQWDPDRDFALNKIEGRRAIQIGIGPPLVKKYVHEWILGISDVSEIVHARGQCAADSVSCGELFHPFPEHVFPVSLETAARLGIARDAVRGRI